MLTILKIVLHKVAGLLCRGSVTFRNRSMASVAEFPPAIIMKPKLGHNSREKRETKGSFLKLAEVKRINCSTTAKGNYNNSLVIH